MAAGQLCDWASTGVGRVSPLDSTVQLGLRHAAGVIPGKPVTLYEPFNKADTVSEMNQL